MKPATAKPATATKTTPRLKPAPVQPAVAPPAAHHKGITATKIGVLAGLALLLLLIVFGVVRATRAALARDRVVVFNPVPALASPAAEPTRVAPVPAPVVDPRDDGAPVEPPLLAASPNGHATTPTPETVAITLWRGYAKARFLARSGPTAACPVAATSAPFRWRAGKSQQPEAAIRAHAELLARLAESGWRSDEYTENDPWYRIDLHRSSELRSPSRQEPAGELPAPSPTPP